MKLVLPIHEKLLLVDTECSLRTKQYSIVFEHLAFTMLANRSTEKHIYLTNINPTSYFTGIVTCPLLSPKVSGGSSLSLK